MHNAILGSLFVKTAAVCCCKIPHFWHN